MRPKDSNNIHRCVKCCTDVGRRTRSLPSLHAFTGCDSISAFSGKRKALALKMVRQNKSFETLFQEKVRSGTSQMNNLPSSKSSHARCTAPPQGPTLLMSYVTGMVLFGTLSIDNEIHDNNVCNPRRIWSRLSFSAGKTKVKQCVVLRR